MTISYIILLTNPSHQSFVLIVHFLSHAKRAGANTRAAVWKHARRSVYSRSTARGRKPSGQLGWAPNECGPKTRYFLSLLCVLYLLTSRFRCPCLWFSDSSRVSQPHRLDPNTYGHRLALYETIVLAPRWIRCDADFQSYRAKLP